MSAREQIGNCMLCGQAIYHGDRPFTGVFGWERPRKGGGTNALRLRKPTGELAHAACVDRAVRGLGHQESLL